MNIKLLLFTIPVVILSTTSSFSQTYSYGWGNTFATANTDRPNSMDMDASENLFIAGTFGGTLDFDPDANTEESRTSNGYDDGFVKKIDANGNLIWVNTFGSSAGSEFLKRVALDNLGNAYVIGYYTGAMDVDPSASEVILTPVGGQDLFIVKYDTNGNLIWAKSIGGTSPVDPGGISIDTDGNCIITGNFQGTMDIDPGSGTTNISSNGSTDIYVVKLDSNGDLIWGHSMGGTSADYSRNTTTDALNNVYVVGDFNGTVDFDPGASTDSRSSNGETDLYVSKFDENGVYQWTKSVGGTGSEIVLSASCDSNNNIVLGGYFNGSFDFDPGANTSTITSNGSSDFYVLKLDVDGNYLWAKGFGSSSADNCFALRTNSSDEILLTGYYSNTIEFDQVNSVSHTSSGNSEVYVLKLNSNGEYINSGSFGGSNLDFGYDLIEDASGNLFVIGVFMGSIDLDPQETSEVFIGNSGFDMYEVKFNPTLDGNNLSSSLTQINDLSFYPNPVKSKIILKENIKGILNIVSLDGKTVLSKKIEDNQIDVSHLEKGIYLINIQTETKTLKGKFVKD